MKKVKVILLVLFVLVGCSESFQAEFTEKSIGIYAESFDDVSKFSNVYGMWKNNVDTLYIQSGVDEFTDTYLLDTMPHIYSTVIKSMNKYDMKAYALLDSDVWMTNEDDVVLKEVKGVLNYNNKFADEKFEGVSVNPNLQNASNKELELYYKNLKEAKQAISIHNESSGDNLILSINIDNELLVESTFSNALKVVDKVIYEDKGNSIKGIEKILSIMDEYDKEVVITIDSDSDFFSNDYVGLLSDLNNRLNHFNNYESFSGFVINDYNEYKDFMKKQKKALKLRPFFACDYLK